MSWYYAENGGRLGPVNEDEFQSLVSTGRITPETLVWKQGLHEWIPYGAYAESQKGGVAVAEDSLSVEKAQCSECRELFPLSDLADFSGSRICGACKPIYIQKLREGLVMVGDVSYGGFWKRFGAKMIDGILQQIVVSILSAIVVVAFFRTESDAAMANVIMSLVGMVLILAVNTYLIGRFGCTPGKGLLKMRIVCADGSRVSYARALGRNLAEFLSGMLLGIGYLIAISDPQRRTLHDRIAGTVVINK